MSKPIEVDGKILVIRPWEMEVGKEYGFDYMGVKMVAAKSDGEGVSVYQVLDSPLTSEEVR